MRALEDWDPPAGTFRLDRVLRLADLPEDATIYVCPVIAGGRASIRRISHSSFPLTNDWFTVVQARCGALCEGCDLPRPHAKLSDLIARDPSLATCPPLPENWAAERARALAPWTLIDETVEEDDD